MATQTQATAAPRALKPYRLTVEQVEKMLVAGIFEGRGRFELLGGRLVATMTKEEPHNFAVEQVAEAFRRLLPPGWFVREEKSVRMGDHWLPEPDVSVFRGRREDLRTRRPGPESLAILVEIADSSYAKDRGPKWVEYAAVRIPAYWIVDVPRKQVEVFSDPAGTGKAARYATVATYGAEAEIPVVLDGQPLGVIAVRDLLF